MGIENLWKKVVPQKEDSPEDKEKKRERMIKGGLAAGIVAAGVGYAESPGLPPMEHAAIPGHEMHMENLDVQAMQEKGPHGATIVSDPEKGTATVNIDLTKKPVTIDLSEKSVNIDPK